MTQSTEGQGALAIKTNGIGRRTTAHLNLTVTMAGDAKVRDMISITPTRQTAK